MQSELRLHSYQKKIFVRIEQKQEDKFKGLERRSKSGGWERNSHARFRGR